MKPTRLFDIVNNRSKNNFNDIALVTKYDGEWMSTTYGNYQKFANQISRGLLRLGVKQGDKVAMLTTNTRTEWNIIDMGVQQIGAISVPIYSSISSKEYKYIFSNAEVKICFASDKRLTDKINQFKDESSALEAVYTFDEVQGENHWKEVLTLGLDESNQNEVDAIKDSIKPNDIVTLIYTSGTLGTPKGVPLTHNNLLSNVLACDSVVPPLPDKPKALSFLPVCHVFERMLVYLYQYNGIAIHYAESIEKIGDNLKEVKPHITTVVPRLLEKVYAKIYETGSNAGGIKTKLFMWALNLVKDYVPYEERSFAWNVQYNLASKIVFSKWREGVGGNIIAMIAGGAKVSPKLNSMFWAAGIPILEGYGLTETSPVIAVNKLTKEGLKIGSVGKPLDNLDVKILEDGEIVVKGPSVFSGYLNNPEETAKAFTSDGYFRTGDIGEIKDGMLYITDRKKEMFKTSGGKYVAPQVLESAMKQIPQIEHIMVTGAGQKMPCALIQPDFDYCRKWADKNNLEIGETYTEIANSEVLKEAIQNQINTINEDFGKWEQIKRIELTDKVWTVEDGLLTPTLKHKRRNIVKEFQSQYNKLYDLD